jgi:cytochrome c553
MMSSTMDGGTAAVAARASFAAAIAAATVIFLAGQANAATGKDIVMKGIGDAPACSACHGENGEGQPDNGFPRLAGLSPAYIQQQLQSFTDGTRKNDIMEPIAKALSGEDRKAVAEYLASLTPPKAVAEAQPDAKAAAEGAVFAADGDWPKGVPGCNQCHGPNGQGVGTMFPRIAGQSAAYIEAQLQAWKDGTRANDPLSLMKDIAAKLDDNQIKAVANYYASLDPLHPMEKAQTEAKGATK